MVPMGINVPVHASVYVHKVPASLTFYQPPLLTQRSVDAAMLLSRIPLDSSISFIAKKALRPH